jgi:hypothetical protein
MLVRVTQQQAQSAHPSNQASPRTTERPERPEQPERPERPEQPERPERPAQPARASSPDVIVSGDNQIIVRNGVPVIPQIPAFPGRFEVHTGIPQDIIPPQAVDISYGFFAMVAAIFIGLPLSRAFGRRLERTAGAKALSPAVMAQMQRIEQAVEAMSIEVERISEAQRYYTKLQAGQHAEPGALPSGDRR